MENSHSSNSRNGEGQLEELCSFAEVCAVDHTKSENCRGDYRYCRIYQELIKYEKKYLRNKKTRNNE